MENGEVYPAAVRRSIQSETVPFITRSSLAIVDDFLNTSAPRFAHIPPSKLQITTFRDTIIPMPHIIRSITADPPAAMRHLVSLFAAEEVEGALVRIRGAEMKTRISAAQPKPMIAAAPM
ncbi:hypothetical protein BBK36DRAFT_1144335 [Trichoderma citrinoviride]|uniref:Uncharacterized protein n=1 Tax=Trichoderma citrinoviride TaxID=58853 RepID=A0A2T4B0G4_9HYPO|nr:hypothetical protein BBK36DRAFT_1144335 [Trichoderma citrinoviride]PTB62790.1 hypothetical protein BBK36DRAFT_1144335 [Trichoderma citrinoviride]